MPSAERGGPLKFKGHQDVLASGRGAHHHRMVQRLIYHAKKKKKKKKRDFSPEIMVFPLKQWFPVVPNSYLDADLLLGTDVLSRTPFTWNGN